jgi:ATP-dependent Clp protease ATP-binding subunit ClpA
MKFQLCAKCKQRPAAVFITKLENGNSTQEGICLQCASELGIKPVNDILKKMGIDEEAIQNMSQEINGLMESGLMEVEGQDDGQDSKVPTLNLGEIFGMPMKPQGEDSPKKKGEGKREAPSKKLLSTYCTNLNHKAASGNIDRIVGRDREIDD